jgi:small subunit ribosomal protein S9
MAIKKVKKEEEIVKEEKKVSQYFYAIGRRKTSIARVKLFLSEEKQNTFLINGKKLNEYFSLERHQDLIKTPLALAGEDLKFEAEIKVYGGGTNSQAEAIRLGIARALVVYDNGLKKSLKDNGFLTRDARKVERKKPGLKKARRAPQWAKR